MCQAQDAKFTGKSRSDLSDKVLVTNSDCINYVELSKMHL